MCKAHWGLHITAILLTAKIQESGLGLEKEDLAEDHSKPSPDPWVGKIPMCGIPWSHVWSRSHVWDSLCPCVGYDPCVGI